MIRDLLVDLIKRIGLYEYTLQSLQKNNLYISYYIHNLVNNNPNKSNPLWLNNYEFKVFSQFGEDGIIEEIFNRIGTSNKYFVEFGSGDGLENNTAYLLLKNWKGLWIEGSKKRYKKILKNLKSIISKNNLITRNEYINSNNIENILQENKVPQEFDLLCIDIDGNDYWVWKNIINFFPRVVVIEYNASLGPTVEWVMKENENHIWDHSNYFGASLKSLELLGQQKGYDLVGTCLAGINSFFVRKDLIKDSFLEPFTSEKHYNPPRYFLYKNNGHKPSYKLLTDY